MNTRTLRIAMAVLFTFLLQKSGCHAADGGEFAGFWRNVKSGSPLTITGAGDYFIIDDGSKKINAVYGDGALKVPGKMGIVLATYDKGNGTLLYLKKDEYRRPQAVSEEPHTAASSSKVDKPAIVPKGPFVRLEHGQDIANQILNELRLLDSAIDQWAIENNKSSGEKAAPADIRTYVKPGSRLYETLGDKEGPKDPLGNSYGPFAVDKIPKVNPSTFAALSDVADANFWSPYK